MTKDELYQIELIKRLGPPVEPYGRIEQSKELFDGECDDFSEKLRDHSKDGSLDFDYSLEVSECADIYRLPEKKRFLWLIDIFHETPRLRIIPEQTPNLNRIHKPIICHTNFTACGEALQGGECWWCEETKSIYVNPASGRYGAETVDQWKAVLEFFTLIGYKNVIDAKLLSWQLRKNT